jgi:hypothetical protein
MHAALVETDMLYVFASPFVDVQPLVLCTVIWWMLFRLMLGGGAGKWHAPIIFR